MSSIQAAAYLWHCNALYFDFHLLVWKYANIKRTGSRKMGKQNE